MAYDLKASSVTTAEGVTNPTLALNLTPASGSSTAMPFIDVMKNSSVWTGGDGKSVPKAYRDEEGYPTEIPPGSSMVNVIFDWQNDEWGAEATRQGRYVLEYEGSGDLQVVGDIDIVSSEPGKIVFDYNSTTLRIVITETDPKGTGDNIRDISMVREEHIELHEAGAIFNPEWIEQVDDAAQFRFMDWMRTNNSQLKGWGGRAEPDDVSWSWLPSVPVEVLVELSNQTGTDPWFTMPHLATDEYVREFATYVRDNLDPELVATVEYSNENWNYLFKQAQWLDAQAKEQWGEGFAFDYQAKRATEVALIWDEVFAEEADDRVVNVLGSQAVNKGVTETLLNGSLWKKHEPDEWVKPSTVFDAVAITNYFGGSTVTSEKGRKDLIAAIEDPDVDANQWMYERLIDPDRWDSIPSMLDFWEIQQELVNDYGLDLLAYEGGQHVHHSFGVDIPADQEKIITDFMKDFVRSDEMAQLYEESWDAWKSVSDGPFMQFGDVGKPGKFGSWTLQANLDDTNSRTEYVWERNEEEEQWWADDRSGDQYLHGVTLLGDATDETFIGTTEEDFLIGAEGDDILVGGQGDDGLHGGDGEDAVLLAGSPDDYTITAEEHGWRVEGPDGSDFVVDVEIFAFDSGHILDLADFVSYSPGTLPPVEPETPPEEPEAPAEETPPPAEEDEASAPAEEPELPPVAEIPPPAEEPELPPVAETPPPAEEPELPPVAETPPPAEEPELPPVAETPPPAEEPELPPVAETPPPAEEPELPLVAETPPPPVEETPVEETPVETVAEQPEIGTITPTPNMVAILEEEEEGSSSLADIFSWIFDLFAALFGGGDDDEGPTAVAEAEVPVDGPSLEEVVPVTETIAENAIVPEAEEEEEFLDLAA